MSKCKFNLFEYTDRWTGERCVFCCVKSNAKVADCPKCEYKSPSTRIATIRK